MFQPPGAFVIRSENNDDPDPEITDQRTGAFAEIDTNVGSQGQNNAGFPYDDWMKDPDQV